MAEEKAWSREKIKAKIEGNELDLSLCSISKVPVNHIIPFGKVTALDLSCNKINTLPENFSKLVQLVQLDLSKNGITELPHDFGELNNLRRLDLFNNNLQELPLTFYKLKSLQWLDLKANPIQEQLPRLVGDCLRPAECQQCAKNIVKHYADLQSEILMQERLAKKLESERKAKEKQEEEQVRQRRKEEKKKRLEEKSLASVQRKSQNTNGNVDITKVEPTCIEGKSSSGRSCTWYLMYFVLLLAVAGLIVAVLLKGDKHQIQLHVDQIVEKSRTYFNKLTKNYLL